VTRPRLVVTGASGFVGRHLLDALKHDYDIVGIARRSQARSGAPVHPSIRWHQADIGDREALSPIFEELKREGGATLLIHLAAHYDFTGEDHPEYWRTNVEGLRHVLELSKGLGLRRFLFSSSTAACAFPRTGQALTETSPPDGDHVYARTKAIGERMLAEYREHFPSTVVRFAALFSDWCEYPPLFMFLETWLSSAWNARILGGRGRSAIPYLHVDDLVLFFLALLERVEDMAPGTVLQASPDEAVSHQQLFDEATQVALGRRPRAIHVPRPLCRPGMWALDLAGRLIGRRPFERPWMARYVDLAMTIDASATRARLGWQPRPRLQVLRRLPFLLENRRMDPVEWNRANRAAMKEVHLETNLRIYRLRVHRGADRAGRPPALPELPAGQRRGPPVEPHADPPSPHERRAHPGALDPGRLLPGSRRASLPAGLPLARGLRRLAGAQPHRLQGAASRPGGREPAARHLRARDDDADLGLRRDPAGLRAARGAGSARSRAGRRAPGGGRAARGRRAAGSSAASITAKNDESAK